MSSTGAAILWLVERTVAKTQQVVMSNAMVTLLDLGCNGPMEPVYTSEASLSTYRFMAMRTSVDKRYLS